jgi:hypothetical protein
MAGIPKTWALSIANIGIVLTALASLYLTGSAWVLISLMLIPLNIFLWQYTRRGIMLVDYGDEQDVQVVFETSKDKERGNCIDHNRTAGNYRVSPGRQNDVQSATGKQGAS